MKKKISIGLIIIGIILALIPTIKDKIIKYNIKNKSEIIEIITHEEIINNMENEAEFNYEAIDDVGTISTVIGAIKFDNKFMIGQLIVPDLDINLPILKGVTNANLLAGVTTMVPEQKMGEGNYPVAGHRMKQKNLLFGSLMDIEIGSIVYITDKETIYEYTIYDTVVVSDTAMEMLDNKRAEEKGKPIISLMTCYYSSNTGKRFFALGELTDEYVVED
ncbi:class A sortase [Tissierella sp.]|uniref:class A sortase n=1 Tax=Tissierella sp. TaxID=41274 RepID=UPI0028AD3197|nr:class A sortase [Tissierella sp.]